jgi:hypothetical protein
MRKDISVIRLRQGFGETRKARETVTAAIERGRNTSSFNHEIFSRRKNNAKEKNSHLVFTVCAGQAVQPCDMACPFLPQIALRLRL